MSPRKLRLGSLVFLQALREQLAASAAKRLANLVTELVQSVVHLAQHPLVLVFLSGHSNHSVYPRLLALTHAFFPLRFVRMRSKKSCFLVSPLSWATVSPSDAALRSLADSIGLLRFILLVSGLARLRGRIGLRRVLHAERLAEPISQLSLGGFLLSYSGCAPGWIKPDS